MDSEPVFECFAPGIPRPQGSKTRTRYGGMRESSKYVPAWRETIRAAAVGVMVERLVKLANKLGDPLRGPLVLGVEFLFARPRATNGHGAHWRACPSCKGRDWRARAITCAGCGGSARILRDEAPAYVTGTPDLDKLIRAVQDSLKTAGVYKDDSQVVGYAGFPRTCKRYANPGEQPGARIRVWTVA
jgi:Holliday junction resolvase RusA-like endonuclease